MLPEIVRSQIVCDEQNIMKTGLFQTAAIRAALFHLSTRSDLRSSNSSPADLDGLVLGNLIGSESGGGETPMRGELQ